MNTWDLTQLYQSFDDPRFQADFHALKDLHREMTNCIGGKEEALETYIHQASAFKAVSERLHCFIMLTQAANTRDQEALKANDQLNDLLASFKKDDVLIERWIGTFDFDTITSPLIRQHRYILEEIKKGQAHALDEESESLIAYMKNTGSYSWAVYKDQLIAGHTVMIDGQRYPLTEVLNMAYSPDQAVRKKAYEAEIESYQAIEQGVAACLNAIKGEVLYTTKLHHYESELQRTCENSRLSIKTLNVLLEVMKKHMPIFRDYLKLKAAYLGHRNGLPWYDLYAPVVASDQLYPYEEGSQFVIAQFNTFSEHLGSFAKRAVHERWIDVEPRPYKVGGAFCENIMSLKQSRFLLNYGSHFSDLITMAHELGHGFHGECLKDESILNTDYPMPIAETASTFCETIVTQAALKKASPDEQLAILENALNDATQVICDIYSRFLFESRFFTLREKGPLSVDQIKTLMLEAQKEAYGDGLDPDALHPYMWTWKPHYYDPDYSFYNFPYAFGLLLAKGLYAMYLEDPSFASRYEQLLAYTGQADLEDVALTVGINLQNPSFWEGSMAVLKEDADRFASLIKARLDGEETQ